MTTELQKLAAEIRNNIDAYAQQAYDDGHRTHLGASLIGDDCKRKLWFTFRHVYHHIHSGRMQRLFNTGHCEESRIISWLRGAGYVVNDLDVNGKQFKVSDCEGHFGGSTDGIITIPGFSKCLLECKTNKTGTEFKMLVEKGMKEMKPKHWAQVCTYGFKLDLKYCLYVCKNKDNDDLYIEFVELDHAHGKKQIEKASEIIFANEMPARLAEQPSYFKCKMCDYVDHCFRNKEPEHNCRSCKNAKPVANAEWYCIEQTSIIPKDVIHIDYSCWESVI